MIMHSYLQISTLGVNQDLICRSDVQFRVGLDTGNNEPDVEQCSSPTPRASN